MAYPNSDWLLDPTIPAPPALPCLDREISALATISEPRPQYSSGTWRVGAHGEADASLPDEDSTDSQRFAKSDSEAPTVRPGALLALRNR
jgi:hypothetical protein